MNGIQHKIVGTGFGIATAMTLIETTGSPMGMLAVPAAIFGSLLPDIDHDMTKMGRKRAATTRVITSTVKMILTAIVVITVIAIAYVLIQFKNQALEYDMKYGMLLLPIVGVIGLSIVAKAITGSDTYKWATDHRGLMHTLIVPALLFWAQSYCKAPYFYIVVHGVMIGYLSHLLADMFTVAGCPILFPLAKWKIRLMRFHSESPALTGVAYILAALPIGLSMFF